jgi:hypothetical protein
MPVVRSGYHGGGKFPGEIRPKRLCRGSAGIGLKGSPVLIGSVLLGSFAFLVWRGSARAERLFDEGADEYIQRDK